MATLRVKRNLEATRALFEAWLASKGGERSRPKVSDIELSGGGASNETFFCRVEWTGREDFVAEQDLVLRIQPDPNDRVLPELSVRSQQQLMQVLGGRYKLPVPAVPFSEPDPTVLGAPFLVMDRVEGRALSDVPSWHVIGWATELPQNAVSTLCEGALAELAALHRLDWQSGFEFLSRHQQTETALDGYLAHVVSWFEWASEGRSLGVIDSALRYVIENRPPDPDCCVLWGDARLGNMLFAQDLSVAAILDWDMAALGPAEIDLGWWLMMDEFFSMAQGIKPLPGVPDRDATIAQYETLLGKPVRDIRYYEILAGLRFALIMVRATDHQERRGLVGPESTKRTNNPVTQLLARWLDLDVPELAPEWAAVAAAWTKRD